MVDIVRLDSKACPPLSTLVQIRSREELTDGALCELLSFEDPKTEVQEGLVWQLVISEPPSLGDMFMTAYPEIFLRCC